MDFYFQKEFIETMNDTWKHISATKILQHGKKDAIKKLQRGSRGRLVFFIIMVALNLCLAGYITYHMLSKVAVSDHLLLIFGINTAGYVMYYLIMKSYYVVRFKKATESISWTCWIYIILACLCIVPALIFYSMPHYNKSLSPSESRHLNSECILGIFDGHALWHFASSFGILFTCMVLLTIEDNNTSTPWNQIPVF